MELKIKGRQGKSVCVDGGSIKITKKSGLLAAKREKSIMIRNITSIDIKKPGLAFAGYIHFDIAGANNFNSSYKVSGGTADAVKDENSIVFANKKDYDIALKIKEYIENYFNNN
jgi:hypothetical protein